MIQIRRILTIAILAALSSTAAIAADNKDKVVTNTKFVSNTFVQTGLGFDFTATPGMMSEFNGVCNFSYDINLGKWFSPYVGIRLGYQGFNMTDWQTPSAVYPGVNQTQGILNGTDMFSVRNDYSYVHADFMWNMLNQFKYKEYRRFELVPYVGIGYMWLYNGYDGCKPVKSDYVANAGLMGSVRINKKLSAFIDYRTNFILHYPNNDSEFAYQTGASMGITYDFLDPSWGRVGKSTHSGFGVSRFFDNSFLGIGGGLTNYIVPSEKAGWNAVAKPVGDIYFGNWFSPGVGARLGFSFSKEGFWTSNAELNNVAMDPGYSYGSEMYRSDILFYHAHADLMWNLCNAIYGYDPVRRWDCIPYLSFNTAVSTNPGDNKPLRYEFFGGIGLLNNLWLSKHVGLNLDLRASYLNKCPTAKNITGSAVLVEALVGTTYSFGNVGWEYYRSSVKSSRERAKLPESVGFILNSSFIDNTFASLYAGVNGVTVKAEGQGFNSRITPSVDIAFGKMLTPSFGVRLGVQGSELSRYGVNPAVGVQTYVNKDGKLVETVGYVHPHLDALFDITTIIGKYKAERVYTLMAYPHAGFVGLLSQDSSKRRLSDGNVGIGAGLLNRFRLSDRVDIDMDLNWTASPVAIEQNTQFNHILTAQLGLSYNMGATTWVHTTDRNFSRYDAYKRKKKNVSGYVLSNKFFDNTFINVMAGANLLFDGSLGFGFNTNPAIAIDATVGKWIVPYLGIRAGYQGRNISEWGSNPSYGTYAVEGTFKDTPLYKESLGYNYFHLDIMTDMMNIIGGYNRARLFALQPYLTAGLMYLTANGYDNIGSRFGIGGGLIGNFNVAERLALNIDLRAVRALGPIVDNSSSGEAIVFTPLAGLTYSFGNSGWGTAVAPVEQPAVDEKINPIRRWAISTNIIGYFDRGTLNVEAQYALSRHFTADVQARLNPWASNGKDSFMEQHTVANVGARYWPWYVYSGLWFRSSLIAANYCLGGIFSNETPERGNSYGLEAAAGYSIIVCPWFNIDFGLGLWGGYKDYRRYENIGMTDVKYQNNNAFIGMSEAALSLVFIF